MLQAAARGAAVRAQMALPEQSMPEAHPSVTAVPHSVKAVGLPPPASLGARESLAAVRAMIGVAAPEVASVGRHSRQRPASDRAEAAEPCSRGEMPVLPVRSHGRAPMESATGSPCTQLTGLFQSTFVARCLLVDWGGQQYQVSSVAEVARALHTRGAGGDSGELQSEGNLIIPRALPESLPQLGGRNALMTPDSLSILPESAVVDMGVSGAMLTNTAQVELALTSHAASDVTYMVMPESPREVSQPVAAESMASSRTLVDEMGVDDGGASIVEAVIAMEIALVNCICKLTAYNGVHGELVSSRSMVSSIRGLAKRLGKMHPRSSTLFALTVAVAQQVWDDQYPSLRLAKGALLTDSEGLRAVSTNASGLQRALVMLARHHGFGGYNLTDLADDMMSRLMDVADHFSWALIEVST